MDELAKTYPVIEVFGPTIQGEGIDQGVPAYFIRFGGCDYKCAWCDSPHAVLPHLVKQNATMMTSGDILDALEALPPGPKWVVLTGGNPCLLELGPVVDLLQRYGYKIALETQGTKYKAWVEAVDRLCLSPKPPSSGVDGLKSRLALDNFVANLSPIVKQVTFLKIVIFGDNDLDWAEGVVKSYSKYRSCLSLGTYPETSISSYLDTGFNRNNVGPDTPDQLAERYRHLIASVVERPAFSDTQLHVQNHVLAFGHAVGV